MKKFARTLCVMLSAILCLSCFSVFAACNNTDGPDKTLIFSVQELDNVFNSFFSTSAYDSEITSNTQIGFITSDADGNPYCGYDEPTVALDYSQIITYKDQDYNPVTDVAPTVDNPDQVDPDEYYTTYRFLIKNGIKFSDGVDLTVKDVIFNLYTYLDPAYYGSSTVYSTPIKGLSQYRLQEEEAGEGKLSQFNRDMLSRANSRLSRIRANYTSDSKLREQFRSELTADEKTALLKDVATVRNLFWDEIQSDWKNAEGEVEDYDEQYGFTEAWEIFLYNQGLIRVTLKSDNATIDTYKSDAEAAGHFDRNGKERKANDKMIDYGDYWRYWRDSDSMTKIVFNAFAGIYTNDNDYGNLIDEKHEKNKNGDYIKPTGDNGPKTDIIVDEQGKAAGSNASNYSDRLFDATTSFSNNLYNIVTYWGTSGTARDQFVAEAKSEYFAARDMAYQTIEGIKVLKLTQGDEFEGVFDTHQISEDQYVLEIKVDRVDPKAIWNFSFYVTPMHYYSNADNSNEYTASVDYRSFNYPVYDKTGEIELPNDGDIWNGNKDKISVGRPFGDKNYLDKVIKASNILSVPVGAGMYRAASENSNEKNYTIPTFTQFCKDNIVYYIYNPYFYTTSGDGKGPEESAICNPKIKYIRYKVINSTKLLDSILQGEVHYGDPQAKEDVVNKITASSNANYIMLQNSGYGYIGINATYVPDLEVRQAIMHAMNTEMVKTYYGEFADLIYRPISSVSWASPQNGKNKYYNDPKYRKPYYEYDESGYTSENLVTSVNVNGNKYQHDSDGVYYRILDDGTKHRLEYTFTIAGSNEDHPAYSTMKKAADILNGKGFKITVKTDSMALAKMASGSLTVWAAAWGAGVDPDMYQVYHVDSAATSVKGWGYPSIIAGQNDPTYRAQYQMLEALAKNIDKARTMLDNKTRADIYIEAYDQLMELAVELPTYQRRNLYAYRTDILDSKTFNTNTSPYSGPLARLWEVDFVK